MMYAAIFGTGTVGLGGVFLGLVLMELCAIGMSRTRRRRLLLASLLLLSLASQVGCDNGSTGGGGGAQTSSSASVAIDSTQTATGIQAMQAMNNAAAPMQGFPVVMGKVALK